MSEYKYVFGPVPSRRLGVSLGIDIIPFKTCSFNCIYCECGRTTKLTINREEFFPYTEILEEVKNYFFKYPKVDYITYSGSGEPTLYKNIGKLTHEIKNLFPHQKIALLTNSSLFFNDEVINDVLEMDLILPSLDAAIEEDFKKIDRPHGKLNLNKIIEGLINLRKKFTGKIWLEIFFAKGINDNENNINALFKAIKKIQPDKVQLNTVDRPPAEPSVEAVSYDFLENIVSQWKNYFKVEIIKRIRDRKDIRSYKRDIEELLYETIKRRPCTLYDLQSMTGLTLLEINKYIDILEDEGKVVSKVINNQVFITLKS